MNSLWPSRGTSDTSGPTNDKQPSADVASVGDAPPPVPAPEAGVAGARNTPATINNAPAASPSRPILVRNQPSPAAPQAPIQTPSAPGQMASQQPPDSLSLAQLRRYVAEFPHAEPLAYEFVYEDFAPVEEEVDEWFVYQYWQWVRLSHIQNAFEEQWGLDFAGQRWEDVGSDGQTKFLREALEAFSDIDQGLRTSAINRVAYIALGRWADTAGGATAAEGRGPEFKSAATDSQLAAMKDGCRLIADADGLGIVWAELRRAFEVFWSDDPQYQPDLLQQAQDDLMNLMTIIYMTLQHCLSYPTEMSTAREKLLGLNPNIAEFMLLAATKLRWDEPGQLPLTHVLLLFWKTILLVFGGIREIEDTKKATCETGTDDKDKNIITASPLDYHNFRQEITSKYPAYIPPQLAIPIEADNSSLLPPLPNQQSRNNGSNGILPGPPNSQASGFSILEEKVHIATPAPSPPPSPSVGGKVGKKQNYQTNQNFPFMYPPLDATSNSAGGKGLAGLQDLLVGRKWEGSDIPASILEAGELFSKRVRMTRATRQLWEEREKFIKYSRGWEDNDNDIVDELDLSSLTLEEKQELGLVKTDREEMPPEVIVDYGPNPEKLSPEICRRLADLEHFYGAALPQLQSLVMVLLKAVVQHVTVLMVTTQQQGQNNAGQNGLRAANGGAPPRGTEATTNGTSPEHSAAIQEENDHTRTREITIKAVSGILILILKWFKLSHILKFEFVTQLLLDSNYIPLVLKLFAHQDVQQTVDSKSDRIESSFFYFCNLRAGAPEKTEEPQQDEESEDEAAPPPIKRQRSPTEKGPGAVNGNDGQQAEDTQPSRPEVDELGCPVNPLPKEPITDFSWRNFFSLINFLRVLQKVCKGKAHRNLLLVHYKSSNILRKSLKVPQPELRLYTLKLFKNQVPYCGRKWRQGNMRVITAVYLHCRPELRDEWLAGSDVDAEVEEALPLEQALRSITHWFNVRRYPGSMGPDLANALREGHDFFARELEKVDLQWLELGDDGVSVGEWEGLAA
ncbi:hypothetical protein MCOR25_010014 [Pyricularia grisea]|uniref:Factor arrest protein 11 n=1 Tax=Pyricularia grisea TaxID=148305 RepID=A0A6P8AWS9_PYRGI|nr:uncharacterized protein PgNI_08587 [Pyricularia grisea]KAI6351306.1 hypothetical protein MCOR25_010014 [Pyricularia grisea]TLD06629.1 hypothetical protein PgNI_08587 [Pyricularia grisea]